MAELVGSGDHGGVVSAAGGVATSRSRRPIAVLAEVLVMRGISEDLAGDLASDLLTALRQTGHSVYLADGSRADDRPA